MKFSLSLLLLLFAVVVFFLIAIKVIDEDTLQWAAGAASAFAASFLPWPSV